MSRGLGDVYKRQSLRKATLQLMCFFVLSHLDYCNFAHLHHFWSNVPPSKNSKSCSQSRFFCESKHERVTPLLKKLHWLPVKERILFKIATFAFHFLWWYPATISVILSLCVHSISYCPFQFWWKNSFQCKMETQGLWSLVILCSGASCLEQPSSPPLTQ